VAAALVLLAALPYLFGGVSDSFIALDDDIYIYENPQVRQGLSAATALWAVRSTEQANWYPLRRLSHLVDVSLFGLHARGHRWVSVGWHAAAALLLLSALNLMTGLARRSFLVAALFAVHPLQVESVAWVSERSNVLAGFFFALTLLLWARHVRRPGPGSFGAVAAACALGLMAKPILVTLPLVLLLLDFWPLGRVAPSSWALPPGSRPARRVVLEKAPLLLLAAASGAMAVVAHLQNRSLSTMETLPLGLRLGNAALSLWSYVGKVLWPAGLAVYYPHPGADLPALRAAAAGLLAAAAIALVLVKARRSPWLATGWLWFVVTLAPMSGIVQFGSHAMADRFAYLPCIGLFLGLVWHAAETLPRRWGASPFPPLAAAALLAAAIGASAVQAGYWSDSETLFRRTLAVTRENWVIRGNLAGVLAAGGRHQEAASEAREAVRIRPNFVTARVNLGGALTSLGDHQGAIEQLREALRLDPGNAVAHYNLGNALAALGRNEEALADYRAALRARPDYAKASLMLGNSLAATERIEEAIVSYREALRASPDLAEAWLNLGILLAARGRTAEAQESLHQALRLRPGLPAASAALERLHRGEPRR
jgi:tetratricopeptide (TPR) repeat protein